jgi:phosphohistidine phosphatase
MALYLVQHGAALAEDVDPERSLSPEGRADAERIAGVAKNYAVRVSRIEHSGKKRAEQTAEIFAAALGPPGGVEPRAGINPTDDVAPVAGQVRADADLMLVGHLPFMEKLTSYLVTGSSERRVFKFQNGGIVCLDQDDEKGEWFIKWALMPDID